MDSATGSDGLDEGELPALYRIADAAAVRAQARYYAEIRTQLAMLVLGTLAGLTGQLTDVDEFAFVGVAAYIVLVVVRVNIKVGSTDRIWYESRLIAESVKSLAWRYSVGGAPFSVDPDADPEVADLALRDRIAGLLGDVSHVPLPDPRQGTEQITASMRSLRAASRDERIRVYAAYRLRVQLNWYAERATVHARRGARLDTTMLVASGIAVFFGFAQALDIVDANFLGLAGIVAAVVATWSATTHYSKQAADYASAAHQLALVETVIAHQDTEEKWAAFVDDAEDGISREHTSWRVTRAQP
jgi:SMODS and SLOG-associating 2TM effector domain 3/SMODS and SLOG-associating 2TM effector domain 1